MVLILGLKVIGTYEKEIVKSLKITKSLLLTVNLMKHAIILRSNFANSEN